MSEQRNYADNEVDQTKALVESAIKAIVYTAMIPNFDPTRFIIGYTTILLEGLANIRERYRKDQSGPTNEVAPSLCQYFFKDAHRYCARKGPHNVHSTEVDLTKDKWSAHSTSAICLICNFTLSSHADEYCPVTVGGVVTKFTLSNPRP